MAFVVAPVAATLGIGAIGEVLLGLATTFGLAYAAQRFGGELVDNQAQGVDLNFTLDGDAPRQIILGKAATAGQLVFANTYGEDNRGLQLAIALADHEIESVERIWIDGKLVTWNSGTGTVTEYPDVLNIQLHKGQPGQTPNAHLVANSGGLWTSNEKGVGIAWVYVFAVYNPELFPGGVPRLLFEVKGAKLYDPRLDDTAGGTGSHRENDSTTWEWSENAALAWRAYRRGIYSQDGTQLIAGCATPASFLGDVMAAANVCDEAVALDAGGNEARYRVSAVISAETDRRQVLRGLVDALAGTEIESGGMFSLDVGVERSPALDDITDDDIVGGEAPEIDFKRPRNELFNTLVGTYRAPDQQYQAIPLPARGSSADATIDGEVLEKSYDLGNVTSVTQGQRVLEIFRRKARRQLRVQVVLLARAVVLEAGDWLQWTSSRYGWPDKLFRVVSATLLKSWTVSLVLEEIDADVFAWTTSDEIAVETPEDLTTAGPTLSTVSGLAVENVVVTAGDNQRPGLHASWTPIGDRTVAAVMFEYRIQGDSVTLARRCELPEDGSYIWVDGVQGGVRYEVRAKPDCVPPRSTSWTSWVATAVAAEPTIVDVATSAESVPPDTITADMLAAQERFELGLVTATEAALGSIAQVKADLLEQSQRAAEAALNSLVVGQTVKTQLTAVATEVNGQRATVSELLESRNGMSAKWAVVIDVNGYIVGAVQLDGSREHSTFTVVADTFQVALPDSLGGNPVPVFVVGEVDGVPKLGFRGDMFVDGTIAARALNVGTLSAISANIGEVTAGVIRSADGRMVIDLDAAEIRITT